MGYEEKKAELGLAYGILDCPTWAGALFYGVQVCLGSGSKISENFREGRAQKCPKQLSVFKKFLNHYGA